ncbi:bublin coiled-coil protein-like [Asterias amurensis]|uniref:bublin coiled-coil protein-like n=1 Tax=Asterias amurensis TaxID=7602 RepID=UPI003AB25C2C
MGEYGEGPKKSSKDDSTSNSLTSTATVEDMEPTEEYTVLGETLDQLDSCLDDLEQKNDSLNNKLKELLESTQQIHQEMSAERLKEEGSDMNTTNS